MSRKPSKAPARIFADFHNADQQGRLRLNCAGTIQDLARHGTVLQSGQQIMVYSEDLEVEGQIEYSADENIWVARIDWDSIRNVSSDVDQAEFGLDANEKETSMPNTVIPVDMGSGEALLP